MQLFLNEGLDYNIGFRRIPDRAFQDCCPRLKWEHGPPTPSEFEGFCSPSSMKIPMLNQHGQTNHYHSSSRTSKMIPGLSEVDPAFGYPAVPFSGHPPARRWSKQNAQGRSWATGPIPAGKPIYGFLGHLSVN